jgi:hypothetical protein
MYEREQVREREGGRGRERERGREGERERGRERGGREGERGRERERGGEGGREREGERERIQILHFCVCVRVRVCVLMGYNGRLHTCAVLVN